MMKNIIEARQHRSQYFVSLGNLKKSFIYKEEDGRWCFGVSLSGVIVQDEWYTIRAYAKLHCIEQEEELALNIGLHF